MLIWFYINNECLNNFIAIGRHSLLKFILNSLGNFSFLLKNIVKVEFRNTSSDYCKNICLDLTLSVG
nr:hypothetical protein Iba_chr01cCG17320 [Ipomoea batatas]